MEQLPTLSSRARVVEICAGRSRYEAVVGSGLLNEIGLRAARLFRARRCAIVSDTKVAPLFAEKVAANLKAAAIETQLIIIAAGENSKTL